MIDGLFGIIEVHQPVFKVDPSGCAGTHPEHGLHQLSTSGPHQAVQSEDLPFPDIERDVLKMRCVLGGEMPNGEDGVSWGVVYRGEPALQRTTHHGGDQLVHIGVLGGFGHNQITIPQHRNLIADLKDLIHLMRDVDQRDPLLFEHPHHLKELVHFLHRQRRGRLVQDDHL